MFGKVEPDCWRLSITFVTSAWIRTCFYFSVHFLIIIVIIIIIIIIIINNIIVIIVFISV